MALQNITDKEISPCPKPTIKDQTDITPGWSFLLMIRPIVKKISVFLT